MRRVSVSNAEGFPTAVAQSANSLGTFFSGQTFSEEERRRLAALATAGAIPAHILKTYVTRADAYKNVFIKRERIHGFRPGTRHYNEQAVQRIITILDDPSSRQYKFCWNLYQACVAYYLKKEMPQLDRLLAEVSRPQGMTTDVDIVRVLCASTADYGVTAEQITTFYEVWGTPRIPDFNVLLPQWMKADDANVQRRQVARMLSELAQLTERVEHLAASVRQHHEESQNAEGAHETSLQKFDGMEGRLKEFSKELVAAAEERARREAAKLIEERVVGLAEKINRLAEKVKVPRDDVSTKDLQKLASETKACITTSINDVADALTKQMRDELSIATQELEAKLGVLVGEVSAKREPAHTATGAGHVTRYRSPLVGPISHTHVQCRLSRELDFVSSWVHQLLHRHDVAITFEQAVAYHRALLSSYVVVCGLPLATSWVECLGWQPYAVHIAASPTWSEEADWAPAAEHLFGGDAGRTPRLAVLHNYEVGLVDCYVVPSLALWALRGPSRGLAKLFLVPSKENHAPSGAILEHALWFQSDDYLATHSLELIDGVRVPPATGREPPVGVEPKLASGWQTDTVQVDYDLGAIQRALKCRLPPTLVDSFERTASAMCKYLKSSGAIAYAMYHQVIPWVQSTYGDTKANELSLLLKAISGDTG